MKRAYEPAEREDGRRFLVDRLWPRGIKREMLSLDAWVKEVAPSDTLRRWFAHDPHRWDEFRRRYAAELDRRPEAWGSHPRGGAQRDRDACAQCPRLHAQQ